MSTWLGTEAPAPMPEEDARADLARRWLRTFAPATEADLKWWTGWTLGQTRAAIAALEVAAVELEDASTGYLLGDDLDPEADVEPWVALVPALDPTAMGWVGRDWYLGPHKAALFDSTGNIGSTIWTDRRIVGGWAYRKDGTLAYRLLEDVGVQVVAAIEEEAAELEAWIGDVRFVPRFPTPLDRELRA